MSGTQSAPKPGPAPRPDAGTPAVEQGRPGATRRGLEGTEFEELYNTHKSAIFYLSLRMLGDSQKAEDATHDVFLKAFSKMSQFRGESSWRTWLYRIAINHCRNLQLAWHERHMFTSDDDSLWER